MRVAVTGASGFTGQHLFPALRHRGFDPISLDVDLTDAPAVAAAVQSLSLDGLIHLAARAFVASDDWRPFYDVNQIGTLTLLDAVARHRPGIRCILASSAQVYGAGCSGLIGEEQRPRPSNHYGTSKLCMELGAERWRDRLEIVIVRPFNYTGVGQQDQYVIPKLVDHFKRRVPVIKLGNIDVRRDFGDVRTVVSAYAGLLEVDRPPPVVNIAAGRLNSIREIHAQLAELAGFAPRIEINPAFVRADDVPELGGDVSLLAATLPDWRPRALHDLLSWMLWGGENEDAGN